MSMYTKGPWLYRESERNYGGGDNSYAVYSIDGDGQENLITRGGCGCCNSEDESIDSEYDARLIAAAPELLEALESLLRVNDSGLRPVAARNKARAAIARAKGE